MPLWLDGKMNVINLEYGNDPLLNSVAALWSVSLIAQLTHGVSLFFHQHDRNLV